MEPESNESEDEEDKGYCLDKGNNLLSRTLLREERKKQKTNEDRNDKRRCNCQSKTIRGNKYYKR